MLPIVGVSLEEALLGFGSDDDTDAELHEKSVFFSLAMITASETGIFEYDPQDEPPSGRPPGPWDGYNFFTVDLSTVKDNIEDMLARIAELEDELEDCHDCWEDVVAAIQVYDPTYNPAEGECPAPKVGEIVDHAKDCDDCKAEVVAKLQEYNPDFNPQTCEDIVDEIDDVYQKGRDDEEEENPPGYTLPEGTDPSDPNVQEIINGNPVTDNNTGATLGFQTYKNPDNSWGAGVYVIVDGVKTDYWYVSGGTAVPVDHFSDMKVWVTDPTTGDWSASVTVHWGIAWSPTVYAGSGRDARLIGYGSTSDTYTVKNG